MSVSVSDMQRLFAKQAARARTADGAIDIGVLASLVEATYADFDRDRRRVDRASALMAEELSEASGRLAESADALRTQNRQFEAALDNMSQGLCLVGADGRIVVSNMRLTSMFGLPPPQDLVGRPFAEVATLADPFRGTSEATGSRARFLALCARTEQAVLNLAAPGQRIVTVVHKPMAEGGFLQTFEDITARHEAEARIAHLATHDVLTDLPNRRLFHQRLEASIGTDAERRPCAVLCLDLDRFKAVNDALGHPAGDQLLMQVTERLRQHAREQDTVARLGGDEFAVIMAEVSDAHHVDAFAARLVEHLSLPYVIDGATVVIGATVGIAQAPRDGSDPHRLIQCADLALYCAKRDGRGRHRAFVPDMDTVARQRHALEIDLRRALVAGEFELHYQPVVTLDAGTVCGFEALLRWNSPARGCVLPDAFIPLAEELGLIVALGDWVLRDACITAAGWPPGLMLAVNVSVRQIREGGLLQSVTDALQTSGLPAGRLELEITESVLMNDDGGALATLHRLRALGVRIVMDDFGTGFASLAFLRSFPFDKIKVDRSFVSDLGLQADAMAIVRAVTGLCEGLGIPSTAEGVETPEQLRMLGLERCTQVQGHLFSRPRPAREIPAMLADIDRTGRLEPAPNRAEAARAHMTTQPADQSTTPV